MGAKRNVWLALTFLMGAVFGGIAVGLASLYDRHIRLSVVRLIHDLKDLEE